MKQMIFCPVCGYRFLPEDALNHGICPSCGTEFGYDDVGRSHEALRSEWLRAGGEWFDKSIGPPSNWSPYIQVMTAFERIRFSGQVPKKPSMTEFQTDIQSIEWERVAG